MAARKQVVEVLITDSAHTIHVAVGAAGAAQVVLRDRPDVCLFISLRLCKLDLWRWAHRPRVGTGRLPGAAGVAGTGLLLALHDKQADEGEDGHTAHGAEDGEQDVARLHDVAVVSAGEVQRRHG